MFPQLPTLLSCRDLSVTISHDLKPAEHIGQMVAKAHQRANIILRSFLSRDVGSLVRAFVVYVRQMVEYIIQSSGPRRLYVILNLSNESKGDSRKGYLVLRHTDDRLSILCLPSLELRRLHIS